MKRSIMIGAVSVIVLAVAPLSQGQTWTGAEDGNWSNTLNWVDGTLPGATAAGGALNNWQEVVDISSGFNPSSNIPLLNGAGTQPVLRVGDGMSIAYTLSDGYDGLNQIRPEGIGGRDAIIVGANGLLTIHPDSSDLITMSRQQNSTTPGGYVYRVGAGGVMDLAANRIDFSANSLRLSHLILDGGTFQMTGATLFYGSRTGGDFSSVYSEMTLTNSATFAGANAVLGNMNYDGNASMIFDLQDVGSTAIFKAGGDFANAAAVEAAFGFNFKSSTLGDANLRVGQVGDTISVTVIPEPATLGLIVMMGAGLIAVRRIFMI